MQQVPRRPCAQGRHHQFCLTANSRLCTLPPLLQYASNAQVVAQYLRALALSGKLSDYAASTAEPGTGEDHKSLSQLLRDLQSQVRIQ